MEEKENARYKNLDNENMERVSIKNKNIGDRSKSIKIKKATPYNKYSAIKAVYNGRKYDSKAEANYAQELDLRLKAKDILLWEPQVTIKLEIEGKLVCSYRADFKVTLKNGIIQYVDVKGMSLPIFKLKMKLLKILHPEINLLIVKKK